jgi:hypothetical protein
MWSSRPAAPADYLTTEERRIIQRHRERAAAKLSETLRTRERADRLRALKAEVAKLEREGL